jgi:hexosaminidase
MVHQYQRYQNSDINYSLSAHQVNITQNLDTTKNAIVVTLSTDVINPTIRYTLDGSDPNSTSKIYKNPILISSSTTLKSGVFNGDRSLGKIRTNHYSIHKAFTKSVELKYPNSKRFDGGGKYSLVNGIMGSSSFSDGNWNGFLGSDMVATIDLGKPQNIERITVDALQDVSSWIFLPTKAVFEVSKDGKQFAPIHVIEDNISSDKGEKITKLFEARASLNEITHIRVSLTNRGKCPQGHSGEGKPAFMFVSEISVE